MEQQLYNAERNSSPITLDPHYWDAQDKAVP